MFNGGTQPLIPGELGWGNGVIMPGESFETDHPESYGPPWTENAEADEALRKAESNLASAEAAVQSAENADGVSGAENAPQNTDLHVAPNGDVTNDAGQVVGHVDPPTA